MKKIKIINKKIYNKIFNRLKQISIVRYIRTNILFFSFVLINLFNSWLLRIVTIGNWFSFKAIISDVAFVLLFGSFCYLLKPKKQIRVLYVETFIFTLISIVNAVYYENYISFASFSLLSTASFLGDMDGAVVTSLIKLKDVFLILPIIILPVVHAILKRKKYYEKVEKIERSKKRFTNTIIASFSFILLTILLMKSSDYSRLKKQWNREYLVQRFGIYVYQLNDAIKSTESKFTSLFGYDNALKNVREYYSNRSSEGKNNYSNVFEGKNVIVIHAESIMTHDMTLSFNNRELTPNLNILAKEGLFFSNYYPQVSVGTSSDTEFTFSTSLLPASTGTVFVNYWDREYESIQKLLKEKNYYSVSMHANNGSFWNRNVMHKKLGYDKFYSKENYDYSDKSKIIGMGLSDKEFFKQSIQKLKKISSKNQNYYATLIMLTNHTPWDDEENYGNYEVNYKYNYTDENGVTSEKVLPYMEGTELGRYFKAVHYADEAIGEFVNELDQEGLLDNTVLVIYGDHDAKISKSEYKYFYNYNFETGEQYSKNDKRFVDVDYYKYELNRKVPFIIWTKDSKNNKLLNKEIKKVMGMYDAMPTLSNMLGVTPKYNLGHDIFNRDDNLVVFPNGNWMTDNIYYNSQKEETYSIKENAISNSEVEKNKEYTNILLEVSDSLIVYDLEREKKNEKKG